MHQIKKKMENLDISRESQRTTDLKKEEYNGLDSEFLEREECHSRDRKNKKLDLYIFTKP